MVDVRDVRMGYGELDVLKGVSLKVRKGGVTCIIGPSGSGKSSLLRSINCLEKIRSGRIIVDGELMGVSRNARERLVELSARRITQQRSHVGMVFQHFNLFPHMTVFQNVVEAPLYLGRLERTRARTEARAMLARVGLEEKFDAYPRQLSGGQQQRVAIVRALMMHPKVMLFDEPTSALDPLLVGEVLQVMRDLAASGMTMVVVTHEMQFARDVADEVIYMQDGVVVEHGAPDEVLRLPRDPRTASFLRRLLHE
ncbi:MAG: amino acid ABC transporter ATP-binding protein [Microbacterium sp.]